ncbi:MAG: hypothetical protein R2824_25680 [Saprospiraceae bacterium]|nr:hypothetical protein [Lewinella sp.]
MKKIALFLLVILFCSAFYYLPKHYFSSPPECHALMVNGDELSANNQQQFRDLIRNQAPKKYRYFFQTFLEEGDQHYMITNFRSEDACFEVKVLVDKWDKLENMRRTNGKSYPEELYGLEWEIKSVNGEEEVVYVDMHKIID